MRIAKWLRTLIWEHPVFWVALGVPLFMHLSKLPDNSWNMEILIARNLLDGFGFVGAPLDPPALWRPPLPVVVLLPIQMLTQDPLRIYAVFGTLALLGFTLAMFYLMKMLGGPLAAHFAQLIILASPAYTMVLNRIYTYNGYLLFLGLATAAVLTTLWSWKRVDWRRDVLSGLCWGAVFLTRPEAILLFGAGLLAYFIFHRSLGLSIRMAAIGILIQGLAFLLIYAPSVVTFSRLQKKYNLIGQESLMTFYAGAHFASNQLTGDIDGEGYIETLERYGTPAKYNYSLIRFMIAHPSAVYIRIGQNLRNFRTIILAQAMFSPWDYTAFLLAGSILIFARPPSLPRSALVGYGMLLVAASPYFLVFHADVRYTLMFVLMLGLFICFTGLSFWTWLGPYLRNSRKWKWLPVLPTIGLIILCSQRLDTAVKTACDHTINMQIWRDLAVSFREKLGISGTPVVLFMGPDETLYSGGDFLWFSYFARTAMPWCGSPTCSAGEKTFPRDKMYSYLGKPLDYLWLPDAKLPSTAAPYKLIAEHVPIASLGPYSLIEVSKH